MFFHSEKAYQAHVFTPAGEVKDLIIRWFQYFGIFSAIVTDIINIVTTYLQQFPFRWCLKLLHALNDFLFVNILRREHQIESGAKKGRWVAGQQT